MTHNDFTHIVASLNALSPEQLEKLRDELDSKLAEVLRQPVAQAAPAASEVPPTQAPTPIWEVFQELSADVPDEVWDALPSDLSEQHDHYIYGTPKRRAE